METEVPQDTDIRASMNGITIEKGKFTKTDPTGPGAYWWDSTGIMEKEPILVHVTNESKSQGWGGLWCGPLVPEGMVQEAFKEAHERKPFRTDVLDLAWTHSEARKNLKRYCGIDLDGN